MTRTTFSSRRLDRSGSRVFGISPCFWFHFGWNYDLHQLPLTSGGRRAPSFSLDEWRVSWLRYVEIWDLPRTIFVGLGLWSQSFPPDFFCLFCRAQVFTLCTLQSKNCFSSKLFLEADGPSIEHRQTRQKGQLDQNSFWICYHGQSVFNCVMGQSHCTRHCHRTFE